MGSGGGGELGSGLGWREQGGGERGVSCSVEIRAAWTRSREIEDESDGDGDGGDGDGDGNGDKDDWGGGWYLWGWVVFVGGGS